MNEILRGPEDLTPEWLTGVLRECDVLPTGLVVGVEARATVPQPVSLTTRIGVRYSSDAPPSAPAALFLKTTRAGTGLGGQREVGFYTTIASQMPDAPAPRCFHAAHSAAQQRFHLLLEDLSDTHYNTEWPLPPDDRQCEAMIDTLASFHAWWWDREGNEEVAEPPSQIDWQQAERDLEAQLSRFVDFLGDRLSTDRRQLLERIIPGQVPLAKKRSLSGRDLTLVHNDAHCWNALLPRDLDAHRLVFIDWGCTVGLGAWDLAIMMALHWYPERRARLEMSLLRRYHRELLAHGVLGYGWNDLMDDYRLCVLRNFVVPLGQWDRGLGAYLWWGHLERTFLAAEDLDILKLL